MPISKGYHEAPATPQLPGIVDCKSFLSEIPATPQLPDLESYRLRVKKNQTSTMAHLVYGEGFPANLGGEKNEFVSAANMKKFAETASREG